VGVRVDDVKKTPHGEDTEAVPLNDQVCFSLYLAYRSLTSFSKTILDPLGLTQQQFMVLLILWEYGAQSVGALMRRLLVEYGTMTPLLKRMEKQGLVVRTRNPEDERTVIITLAPKAQALQAHAPAVYQALCDKFEWTDERAQAAHAVLLPMVDRDRVAADTAAVE
jgi:DNA-binding MarR family transcriptional regulator